MRKNNKKGFTLTELIVVIAVSGILFSMISLMVSSFYSLYSTSTDASIANNEINSVHTIFNKVCNKAANNGETLLYDEETSKLYIDSDIYLIWITKNSEGQYVISYSTNNIENDQVEYEEEVLKHIKDIQINKIPGQAYFDILEVTVISEKNSKKVLYEVIK